MRTFVKIVLLVMLTAGLSSCEKIKSIFDVEFDTTLSGDIDIDIQESAKKSTNGYKFSSFADIDPLDDEDIAEYFDNIKDFAVEGVVAEIVYLSKEKVLFESGTFFTISDGGTTATWTLDGDRTITEGTEITLDDIADIYEGVADILNKKGKFKVTADGNCSDTNVSFTIRINIGTEVTANPL